MNSFLEALNHPVNAFWHHKKAISWVLVGVTILINSVFESIFRYFCDANACTLDIVHMLKIIMLGILAYISICAVFWIVCKGFGSKTTFSEHIHAWGITYFPTAFCSVVVAVTEVFFYVFWNSTVWGMIFSFIFIGILFWKAILYILYLKEFADLKGGRFIGAVQKLVSRRYS